MTYHKVEYTLHNGQKIYVQYDDQNVCKVTKECIEMLLDLYQQGRTEAKEDTNLKDTIREIHDNVAREMYCKGIDDLTEKLKEMANNSSTKYIRLSEKETITTYGVEQIAEQLKAGVKDE